ncbi:MAG: hypothetical protein WDZ59_00590 [Pirellulales bacterium]
MAKKKKSKAKGKGTDFKGMLIQHGEKFVMALVGLVGVWLIYSATQRESLDENRSPDQLRTLADQAQSNIEQADWDPNEKLQAIAIAAPQDADAQLAAIPLAPYDTKVPFDPITIPRKKVRSDPDLLPVEELEVSAGVGLIAMQLPQGAVRPVVVPTPTELMNPQQADGIRKIPTEVLPGGAASSSGEIKGQFWAVVVGKVPTAAQQELYRQALATADSQSVPPPEYWAYSVQRAEVTGSGEPNWVHVRTVFSSDMPQQQPRLEDIQKQWQKAAAPLADQRYIDIKLFTHPLPPLVRREWDRSVVHSDIPLQMPKDSPSAPSTAAAGTPRVHAEPAPQPQEGGFNFQMRPDANEQTAQTIVENTEPPVKLFRYFDFNVQPGKSYRYKVELVLKDPNHGLSPKELDEAVADRLSKQAPNITYRKTGASQPSPAVTVPLPGRVLAGPVTEKPNREPMASVIVSTLNMNQGTEHATQREMPRGGAANMVAKATEIDVELSQLRDMESHNFVTDAVVLDFYGGQELGERKFRSTEPLLKAPTHMLLMGPGGSLTVQSEMDNFQEYRQYEMMLNPEETAQPALQGADELEPDDEDGRRRRPQRGRRGRGQETQPPGLQNQ